MTVKIHAVLLSILLTSTSVHAQPQQQRPQNQTQQTIEQRVHAELGRLRIEVIALAVQAEVLNDLLAKANLKIQEFEAKAKEAPDAK